MTAVESTTVRESGGERRVWRRSLVMAASFLLVFAAALAIWMLARPILLLLAGIVIAQALAPVVSLLCRWLPRVLATILVYLVVFGVIAGGIWLILPMFVEEGRQLVEATPGYIERGQAALANLDGGSRDQVIGGAQSALQQFGDVLLAVPMTLFSSTIDIVLVIFMSIYWLIATPKLHAFAMSLVPADGRERAADVLREMGSTMGGFVRGTAIDGAIVAALAYTGLAIIGVEYALLLAIVQGLGEIIPIVGPIIAAVPALLVALLDSPQQALIVLVFILILQQIESNVLIPIVMRNQADIPPLITLVAVLAGGSLGGLLGALVAIPLGGALQVFVVRVLAPALRALLRIDDEEQRPGAEGEVSEPEPADA